MSTLHELLNKMPTDSQERIHAESCELIIDYRLQLLREELQLSQAHLAKQMQISQPTLSAIENRGTDNKLSTIKRYVEGLGGKLSVHVELPDGRHIGFSV
ncbi:Helix-turn-helix domain-containing protein [Moraxella cuniculi DSM 21768]|uniref:Helix-turn-helix domain-containing protein n=1 Tax=Moraxella cuniculi DSM 21768 TaxID=1122245 RepID=A0A1N7GB04_9GAMM|nr:helix-turn-helix transcriptional regulator [Moraxella cuniculi]OOS01331.1 transcriptional regulator [Moraxella cuniculi]SIS09755.1 Helix-turn-helix domain-containing protein [Moraxella cuniculi DSM 21768]